LQAMIDMNGQQRDLVNGAGTGKRMRQNRRIQAAAEGDDITIRLPGDISKLGEPAQQRLRGKRHASLNLPKPARRRCR